MPRGVIDWLRLEERIRQELRTVRDHKDSKDFALILSAISDILGQETGRGYELSDDWYLQFEPKEGRNA